MVEVAQTRGDKLYYLYTSSIKIRYKSNAGWKVDDVNKKTVKLKNHKGLVRIPNPIKFVVINLIPEKVTLLP
jgi:hypothetical protein